ncbi:hypothetical protein BUZ57_11785 [Staphylococcus hyicus]|uniref:Cytosolic protein n=1 Tax=Staphylococcus hyicus TaxID=1284 RepID=A0A418JG67_STAHY|nr:hypothetical protein [Staphylococcus hyicus]MDP4461337.1 hypothetical protein [Staphylococcus hyicus]MDP4469407.1 hypothetical protein [Staphylococcus hyicus]NJH80576.1 hypothetical protein [Staphylococcus hyicus]RIO42648.1 hypothetical protein BUZ57_11785 [Staphylococcus hyicus]
MNNITPINIYTEKNSAISYKSYEVETNMLNNVSEKDIKRRLNNDAKKLYFPPNREYIDSILDKKTGMSVVAIKDTHTNKVTIGFKGTNIGSGNTSDMIKDVGADINIDLSLLDAQDSYFNETNKFINKIKKDYEIEAFTGHSKGGRDATDLAIEHGITTANASLEYIYVKSMN